MAEPKPLINLNSGNIVLILAPFCAGKTSLLQFLILQQIQNIAAIVLFSNTGRDAYAANYSWLNSKYIYDSWDEEILEKLKKLGKRIKKADKNKHLLLIFDDSIGMAKSLFASEKAKQIITTLRHYNISIIISTHQLQKEVTILVRQNFKDVFLFGQTEPNGVKLCYELWGSSSTNLSDLKQFQEVISTLPKYNFMHLNTETRSWQTAQIPYPLPDFRIALHPSDQLVEDKLVLFGNKENFNLRSIERPDDEVDDVSDDEREPLYRNPPPEELGEDPANPEIDHDDPISLLAKDLVETEDEEPKPEKKATKKRKAKEAPVKSKKNKKDVTQTLLESIDESEQKSGNFENLSKEDSILRHRFLHTLKYIQGTPGNPDRLLLDDRNPSFLQRSFDLMSFQELKDAYREYANHKSMNGLICGIENRCRGIEGVVHQAARHILDWEGDPSIFTGHLRGMRHESVLGALARSNPYKQESVNTVDQLANIFLPMATAGYAVWNFKNKKKEDEQKLAQPIPESETESYLSNVIVPELPTEE